jgi:hypothetical protein
VFCVPPSVPNTSGTPRSQRRYAQRLTLSTGPTQSFDFALQAPSDSSQTRYRLTNNTGDRDLITSDGDMMEMRVRCDLVTGDTQTEDMLPADLSGHSRS